MATLVSESNARRAVGHSEEVNVGAVGWNLVGAWLVTASLMLFLIGGAWDIQWHVAVGRDRALTAPHVMILLGIALSGLTSLAWVLGNTWQARRNGPSAGQNRVLGIFYAPIGFAWAGGGALLGAIAFPLDDYWHTLYGIDVTLWAPFHIMIISSMVLTGLGSLAVFAAELRRATSRNRLITQISFVAALAITFTTLLLFLSQANYQEGLRQIGTYAFVLYPILLAFMLPIALLPAVTITKLPGAATLMALIFLAVRQTMFWFVPWAVHTTVVAEGLSYRRTDGIFTVTPQALPTAILGAAIAIDLVYWLMQRRGRVNVWVLGTVWLTAVGATFWDQPWVATMTRFHFPNLDVQSVFMNALPFTAVAALLGLGTALLMSRALLVAGEGGSHA